MMGVNSNGTGPRNLLSSKGIVLVCFLSFLAMLIFVQTYLPPRILEYISRESITQIIERTMPASNFGSCKYEKYDNWPFIDEFPYLNEKRNKLLYVKTPKSASSTISHILQRYTTRHNLSVAYPDFENDKWVLLDESDGMDAKLRAVGETRSEVDALVSHVVYNSTWVNKLLGTDRPFRITSVRDPMARSWSMFLHGLEFNITEFTFGATNAWDFAQLLELNSQSSYMSGFGSGIDMNNATQVTGHYDHIVPSNRVLESMITLAPKLGLHASDLLYFSQKTSFHKTPLDVVTPEEKVEIEKIMEGKTRVDSEILKIAQERLEEELDKLPEKITSISTDIPIMLKEIKQVCGHIHPEDESCLDDKQVRWDGNAMCLYECIEKWSRRNIYCTREIYAN